MDVIPQVGDPQPAVTLEFDAARIAADTTRMELAKGGDVAIVGQVRRYDSTKRTVQLEPLVIGGPSLVPSSPDLSRANAMWLGYAFVAVENEGTLHILLNSLPQRRRASRSDPQPPSRWCSIAPARWPTVVSTPP